MSKENVHSVVGKKVDSPVSSTHEILKPRWTKLEYVWQIDSFWEIRALASIDALDSDGGDVIWSQRFGDEKHGVWRLKCYPFGDTSTVGRSHVSLFLSLDTESFPDMKAYAIFGCSVLDGNGDKVPGTGRSYTRQKFNSESNSWGWSQYIKVDGHALTRTLTHDQQSLIVRCEIDTFLGLERSPGFEVPIPRTLAEDVIAYASLPKNCDVTVKYGRGGEREYCGNSFLMAARCNFFRSLFSTPDVVSTNKSPETIEESHNENDDDEFGSFEDETRNGALYARTDKLHKVTPDKFPYFDPVATMTRNSSDSFVVTMDPSFSESAVLAFLTHCHVGENAFTSSVKFPASNSSLKQMCELVQLAHRSGFLALFHECIDNLGGRMVTKEAALVVNKIAKEVDCDQLEKHSKIITVDCYRHSDREQLMNMILPPPAREPFRGAVKSLGRRSEVQRSNSDA
eukprot:GHVH01004148.1.p2 GENE.GHVH01004148.1~~GHVH01004148.1.p2  ORF type:complete len:455 (+),score=62.59 GHVH01004148.1:3093-4457(+)